MSAETAKLVARMAAAMRGDRRFTADTQHILTEAADLMNPNRYEAGDGARFAASTAFLSDLTNRCERTVQRALAVGVSTGLLIPDGVSRYQTIWYFIDHEWIDAALQKKDDERRQCFARHRGDRSVAKGRQFSRQRVTDQSRKGDRAVTHTSSSFTSTLETSSAYPRRPVSRDEHATPATPPRHDGNAANANEAGRHRQASPPAGGSPPTEADARRLALAIYAELDADHAPTPSDERETLAWLQNRVPYNLALEVVRELVRQERRINPGWMPRGLYVFNRWVASMALRTASR